MIIFTGIVAIMWLAIPLLLIATVLIILLTPVAAVVRAILSEVNKRLGLY